MHIDLNADLGEGGSCDAELLGLCSSANISCGVHAGDADTMATAMRLALARGVRIGAHPSFPDRENMGRSEMQLPFSSLRNHLLYQLGAIAQLARTDGARLSHIKPHGALYNQAAVDRELAESLVFIFQEFDPSLALMTLAGGELEYAGRQAGLQVIAEGFADRRYTMFGTLLPRDEPGAVIHDTTEAVSQSLQMIREQTVIANDGTPVRIRADSLCIHGDTPEALQLARALHVSFQNAGIQIR